MNMEAKELRMCLPIRLCIYRIMDSEPEKRMELRRMLVDNYSVFYTIRDERVIVTDVLYTASDIEARLRGEL